MNSKIFLRIESTFVNIFCVLTAMYLVILTIDLIQFASNPSDYASVYQKDFGDNTWVKDYIVRELMLVLSCFLIFGLSIWRLIKPNKTLRLTVDFLYIVVIVFASIGFYNWSLTGFDIL